MDSAVSFLFVVTIVVNTHIAKLREECYNLNSAYKQSFEIRTASLFRRTSFFVEKSAVPSVPAILSSASCFLPSGVHLPCFIVLHQIKALRLFPKLGILSRDSVQLGRIFSLWFFQLFQALLHGNNVLWQFSGSIVLGIFQRFQK